MVWCGASSRRPGCVEIALSALFHSLSALAGGVAGFPESKDPAASQLSSQVLVPGL